MTRARDLSNDEANNGGATPPFVAGKNKVINADFGVWQRGTSFTNPTDNTYTCDRYKQNGNGSGFTKIWSRQTFTPGTAPVAGYESAYFYRFNQTVAGTGGTNNNIAIYVHEDVRTFAAQTVTLSFWAKADATRSLFLFYGQEFNNSGSGDQYPSIATATLSTSWTRYTFTFTVASIAGKTIGAGFTGNFQLVFNAANNIVQTIDLWGIQLEAGNVATPFQTATGTPQGELAACQRYYWQTQYNPNGATTVMVGGIGISSAAVAQVYCAHPVTMRAIPSASLNGTSNLVFYNGAGGGMTYAISSITSQNSSTTSGTLNIAATGITVNAIYNLIALTGGYGYLAFSSEL
jgi:hypothetical protein